MAGVEPANHAAKRAQQPATFWRMGCFGSQSAEGIRFDVRLLALAATCTQHRNLFDYLACASSRAVQMLRGYISYTQTTREDTDVPNPFDSISYYHLPV